MRYSEKINSILNSKQKIYLVILFISSIVLSFLEMIGIGSIGLFVAILSESQNFIKNIPIESIQTFLLELEKKDLIILAGISLCVVFIVKNLLIILYNYFELKIRKNIILDVSKKTYSNYLYRDINFHKNNNSSDLINNILSKTTHATTYTLLMITIFKDSVLILFLISGLLWINFNFSILIFIVISVISLSFYLGIKNLIRGLGKRSLVFEQRLLQSLNEGLGGIKLTKLLNNYNFFINEFINLRSKRLDLDLISRILALLPRLFLEVFAIIIMSFITIYLLKKNLNLNEMLPLLTVISVIIIRMIPSFTNLNIGLQNLRLMSSPFDEISSETKVDYKIINKEKSNKIFDISEIESVSVKDLNFGYEDKKNLIKNLNIELKRGHFTALIGETGSGKTTLVDIILGLIPPASGKLVINNKFEYNNFKVLNPVIGYVPQDIYLADAPIINNIAIGLDDEKIDINQVNKVIELAQLGPFINKLSDGIYSKVGDRGFRISGGQRQRLGIARALYRNPKILIMDESTNSLDETTEKAFFKDIKFISKNIITLLITHKISNLINCDFIYKLESGSLKKIEERK